MPEQKFKLSTETIVTDNKKLGRGNRQFHGEVVYYIKVEGGDKFRISKSYYDRKQKELESQNKKGA